MNRLVVVMCVGVLAACASKQKVAKKEANDGQPAPLRGWAKHEAYAIEAVKQRVGFDLECQDVQITRLGDMQHITGMMSATNLGVVGCGKKASYYVECVSNWGNLSCNARMNTIGSTTSSPPAP